MSYLDRHGIVPLLRDNLARQDGEHAVVVSKDNIRQGAIAHERDLGCRRRVEIVQEFVASGRFLLLMPKDMDTERLLNGDCLSSEDRVRWVEGFFRLGRRRPQVCMRPVLCLCAYFCLFILLTPWWSLSS